MRSPLHAGTAAAKISGADARRDCSEACRAMRCHRSTRFWRGLGEMGLGALSDHRNDSADAQLHTLLNGPLHAIEFEDGEDEGQVWGPERQE